MKTTKYNKSEILKRAWKLFRQNGSTFSNALKSAWWFAKKQVSEANTVYNSVGEIIRETEKAIQFTSYLGKKLVNVWLPKSQITISQEGNHTVITMPYWLANKLKKTSS